MKQFSHINKAVLIFTGGTALLFLLIAVHLLQSSSEIPVKTVLESVFGNGSSLQHHIVRNVYIPRIVIGIIAGSALAASGVIFQTLTRNPLASPSTLGVHSGAYFFVVTGTVFGPSWLSGNGFLLAFIGGIFAALIVFILAGGYTATPVRMVLAGMVLTLMFTSFTSALQIFFEYETAGLFLWGNGTLVQQDWNGIKFSFPWVLFISIIILLLSRKMDILLLGKDQAKTLGENVKTVQLLMFFSAVGLTALVVSVVGPIAFIGLIAPHLIRLAGFQLHGILIAASMIWGANLLIAADITGRLLDPSLTELPVGAITALVGSPWLIWLILKHRNRLFGSESNRNISPGHVALNISYPVIVLCSSLLLIISFFAGLSGGIDGFAFKETWQALFSEEPSGQRFIIFDLRLGRLLTATLAGVLLALSGLLFQGVLRNPLADPSIIGVTSGAGTGALIIMFVFSGFSADWIPVGAIIGSFIAVSIVLFLSWKTQFQPAVLALIGMAVTASGGAITQIIITRSNMNAASALTWLSGSTYATGYSELQQFLVWPILLLIPISSILMYKLNILTLGDSTAIGLGLKTGSVRLVASIIATTAAAMAVASVGTIGFIGLVAPHLARLVVGPDNRKVLPIALLFGASLLIAADLIGRMILAPKEIPSGLVSAMIGAPFFLWLMSRTSKS